MGQHIIKVIFFCYRLSYFTDLPLPAGRQVSLTCLPAACLCCTSSIVDFVIRCVLLSHFRVSQACHGEDAKTTACFVNCQSKYI